MSVTRDKSQSVQAGGCSLSGSMTSAGDSSGLARSTRSAWRKDRPDQAVSAETSTTRGSTRVSVTGSLSLLNLSRVVPFTEVGHGCWLLGGLSHRASSRASAVFKGADRPTIRSSPSRKRPATTSDGWVIGPITAPQTISMVSLYFSFNLICTSEQVLDAPHADRYANTKLLLQHSETLMGLACLLDQLAAASMRQQN